MPPTQSDPRQRPARRRPSLFLAARVLLCALLGAPHVVTGEDAPHPRSGAASDAQLPSSKHTAQAALPVEDVLFGTDAAGLARHSQCALDVTLVWNAQMDVGVYSTGAAVHLYSDGASSGGGGKQLVIPGFHRELSLLDRDGHHVPGSPFVLPVESYFHGSPVLWDFNQDGTKDLLWISVDGEVLLLNGDANAADEDAQLEDVWRLPKMKMRRDWHKNLADEPIRDDGRRGSQVGDPPTDDTDFLANLPRGRRLLEASANELAQPSAERDPSHPLSVVQREKALRRITQLVRRQVHSMRQQQRQTDGGMEQPQEGVAAPTGRRLLQQADGAGTGRINRRRLGRRGAVPAAPAAAAAAAASEPAKAAATSPTTASPSAAAPVTDDAVSRANVDGSSKQSDASDLGAESSDAANSVEPGRDEPMPLNAAIGVPLGNTEEEEAEQQKPILDRQPGLPIDTQQQDGGISEAEWEQWRYERSLELPPDVFTDDRGGFVTDQDGGPEWRDDDEELRGESMLREDQMGDLRAGEWVAGVRPGGSDGDFTPEEVRAALDDILDGGQPDWVSQLGQYAADAAASRGGDADVPRQPGGDDPRTVYARVVRELAAKHARAEADIAARQAARQQRPSAAEIEAAVEAAIEAEDPTLRDESIHLTGIASVDETAVKALHERRRIARERRMNVTSNIERILGTMQGELPPSAEELADGAGVFATDAQLLDGVPDEARDSFSLFADPTLGTSKRGNSVLSDLDAEVAWELAELDRLYPTTDERYVWVDAHVLASPVLADLDNDGRPELLVPVSYYFDENDYAARPALRRRLGAHVDLKNYVAGALLVLDPFTHAVLWTEHLDQSTARTARTAHLYASPSVVDLQADGDVDVLIPTGMGFVYAFNSRMHSLLSGWPVLLAEVQAPLAVGDINQDGVLEVVACDGRGNVVALRPDGSELWTRQVSGYSLGGAALGDVNGDGMIDVAVGTLAGHLWVLSGKDGKALPHFPLRTDGRVVAPLTLVSLYPEATTSDLLLSPLTAAAARRGTHIVFPSFDGHVYLVEGRSGCATKLDIGEHTYAQVLADDVLGRGKIDLIVATMNGNVFAFATESVVSDKHPLRAAPAYTSRQAGQAGLLREGYHGVAISAQSREALLDCSGQEVEVEYTIVDERSKVRLTKGKGKGAAAAASSDLGALVPPRYEVSFFFAGELVQQRVHLLPGVYRASLPTGAVPRYTTLEVRLLNEHGQLFTDETVAGLNVHFYRIIKYLVAGPFLLMAALLLLLQTQPRALPS